MDEIVAAPAGASQEVLLADQLREIARGHFANPDLVAHRKGLDVVIEQVGIAMPTVVDGTPSTGTGPNMQKLTAASLSRWTFRDGSAQFRYTSSDNPNIDIVLPDTPGSRAYAMFSVAQGTSLQKPPAVESETLDAMTANLSGGQPYNPSKYFIAHGRNGDRLQRRGLFGLAALIGTRLGRRR